MSLCVLLLLVTSALAIEVDIPSVGKVKGLTSATVWTRRPVNHFRGIPYAMAPSGDRRFKRAVKAAAWTEVRDATVQGQACPQPGVVTKPSLSMRTMEAWLVEPRDTASEDPEDCLTLDVYSPVNATKDTPKVPVLVFLHGGAFLIGSSSPYGPGFLLEKDIVLVVPQYRLGAFGFFSLNTNDAPGNAGLSDQVLALQWVRDNVAVFGGDPARVTIAGSSAGGASVSLHMVSPSSQGLFHGVIALGGSALAPWAVDMTGGEIASRSVAKFAGCTEEGAAALAKCMRLRTVGNITEATLALSLADRKKGLLGMGSYMPTVQRAVEGVEPVMTQNPQATLESGEYAHVPLMLGVSRHEGIFFLDQTYQFFLVPNKYENNSTFLSNDLIPSFLAISGISDPNKIVANSILKTYFKDSDVGNFTRMTPGLVDFTGSVMLKAASQMQASLHSSRKSTYLYTFDYYGKYTLFNKTSTAVPVPGGITHGDDTLYLFPRKGYPLDKDDTVVAKRMVELITNFVSAGNPTPANSKMSGVPKWPAYTTAKGEYLSIGKSASVRTDYQSTFTIAGDTGLAKPSAASLSHASAALAVISAIIYLMH